MLDVAETTENLLEALSKFQPQKSEPVFFVYYNKDMQVICISPQQQDEFKHFGYAIFKLADVDDFLSGRKNLNDYVLIQDHDDLNNFSFIERKEEIKQIIQVNSFLFEIEGEDSEAHVTVEHNLEDKFIIFSISEKLRSKFREQADYVQIEEVSLEGVQELEFFFTKKGDPGFLIHAISVPVFRLVNGNFYAEYETDLSNTSLFTKKVLNKYSYVVN